jgi:hypothetical protein
MRRIRGAVLAAVAVLLVAAPARAGDEEDRVREVEDNLKRMKDNLYGLSSASSSSGVEEAIRNAYRVKEAADKLRSMAQNEPGKTMGSYYPGYADKFQESARYLKDMKEAQLKQENERLSEKCYEADRNFKAEMNAFVEKKDPNGLNKIPDQADRYQRELGEPYKKMQELHREMERSKGYARNFSETNGYWSDVKDKMYSGVDEIWDRWNRRMEETRYKCEEIAKGKENAAVKDAIAKLGESNKSRQAIYDRMNGLLDQAASSLSGVAGRTGTSELDSTIGVSNDVLSSLDALRNARGEEDTAKRISDAWPDKAKELRRSLEVLKLMKQQQFSFDPLPAMCKTAEDELLRTARQYVGDPDDATEGVKIVTAAAEKLANEWRGRLDAADRKVQEQERYQGEAMRFSFDEQKWRGVKDRVHEGAAGIYKHTKDKVEEAKSTCSRLVLGPNNPEVKDALKKMTDANYAVDQTLKRILADYTEWKKERLGLKPRGRFRQESAEKLQQAFCDEDEMQIKDRVQRVADEVATNLGNARNQLLQRLQKLIDEARALEKTKDATLKAEALRQRGNMQRTYKRLEDAGNLGVLRGRNNPMINMYLETGNRKHLSLQTGCTAMEYEIPGGRIDCVNVSDGSCQVIEIKPNSRTGIGAGNKQLEQRKRVFDDQFANNRVQGIMARCVKDGKLNIEYKLVTYEYCPVRIEDIDVTSEDADE